MIDGAFAKASPANLFLELWSIAQRFDPHELLEPGDLRDRTFRTKLKAALAKDDASTAASSAYALIYPQGTEKDPPAKPEILAAIEIIDEVFFKIHPRAMNRTTRGAAEKLPDWLKDARRTRRQGACYAKKEARRLIARGPLLRANRAPFDSSGASLADHVACLAVVDLAGLHHEGRPITVDHFVVDNSIGRGISRLEDTATGRESVLCIPVLERRSDLLCTTRSSNPHMFVRYAPDETVCPSQRILDSLDEHGKMADIVVAPELALSPQHFESLSEELDRRGSDRRQFSMMVAGSLNTATAGSDLPFNEAGVVNAVGAVLWRQRKVWNACSEALYASRFGVVDAGTSGKVFEDNQCAKEISVVDTDDLGRCVILICQDIQADPLAYELIRQYQPDWVFIPILDRAVESGNWVHRRAWALSAISPARFIVANSAALYEGEPLDEHGCALVLGPAKDDEMARAVAVLSASRTMAPMRAHIQWMDETDSRWKQTHIGSIPRTT